MNILYITENDPSLNSSGVQQRTHILHQLLSEYASVYTFVIDWIPRGTSYDPKRRILHHSYVKRFSAKWFATGILSKIFPHIKFPYINRSKRICEKYIPGVKFDAVVVRYISNAAYITAWEIAPMIIDVDDVPSKSFRKPDSFLSRMFFFWNLFWTRLYERKIAKYAVALLLPDKKQFSCFPNRKCFFFPNIPIVRENPSKGSDSDSSPAGTRSRYILTVGSLFHHPNVQGIDYFLDHYWEKIHSGYPDIVYRIAGGGLPGDFADKWSRIPGVEVLGFVDDLDSLYSSCLCCLVPIYLGSGTCIKVAESLMHGCDCLCTPHAVRGIDEDQITKENGLWIFNNITELQECLEKIIHRTDTESSDACRHISSFAEKVWNIRVLRKETANVFDYFSDVCGNADRFQRGRQ